MTKRTAADFASEAPDDGPWTYVLESGRELTPRPRPHYTYDEQVAEANLSLEWARRIATYQGGQDAEGPEPESNFHFGLKVRFSKPNAYVEACRKARESGKPVKISLPDYDAFWAEVSLWPTDAIHKLVRELDAHYPTEGTDQEQADAAADPQGDAAGKSRGGETSSTATDANSNGTSPTSASTSSTSGADDTAGASSTP